MLTLHLFKRQANRRGIFLLSLFSVYALILLFITVKELMHSSVQGFWWLTGQIYLLLMVLMSLVTPTVALIIPGFSYKGHPGIRHVTLPLAGGIFLLISIIIVTTNILSPFLPSNYSLTLFSLVYPLHGVHCFVVYASYFKGPTSKFGKIYQPYLPWYSGTWTKENKKKDCHSPFLRMSYYTSYDAEVNKIKTYERYWPGTVTLSALLILSTFLFVYRMWGVMIKDCPWAINDFYFIPPFHFVFYGMMIFIDPREHLETLCLFGKIMMPVNAFLYCAYMSYQSYVHASLLELVFHCFLTLVQVSLLLPESALTKFFRPFLRRPDGEIEAERMEIIRKFRLPQEK